ncbi:hypothetical protein C1646_764087 [Rhizophagus diaphanus]|nr:hypothetical protein C1646_764087 [Rhizophagus diaphanus] [Rhizophagus sp. MUCL 43196]
MPLVYALMSNKSEEAYRVLFQELIDFSDEYDVDLQLQFIITNFKITAINTVTEITCNIDQDIMILLINVNFGSLQQSDKK